MNYYFKYENVETLLLLEEEIFNNYKRLIGLKKGTTDFYEAIGILEKLSIEEDKYLEKLPDLSSSLDSISLSVRNNFTNCNRLVLNRFYDLLNKKSCIIDDNYNDKSNYFERLSVYRNVKNNYYIKFIKSICKFYNGMWLIPAYCNKDVSDKLISLNFNFDDLDDFFTFDMSYDSEMIYQIYNDSMYEESLDVLADIILNYDKNNSSIDDYNMTFLKFLLTNVCDMNFQKIYGRFNDDLSKIDDDLSLLSDLFNSVYNERYGDIYIKDVDMVNLIDLFKLEEVILKNYRNNNDKIVNNLISFENEMISSINIDNDINNIIENDLGLYINSNEEDLYLIKTRLLNLFSDYYDVNSKCIFKNYEMIISNHIVRTIDNNYSILSTEEFKNVLFMYPFLDYNLLMSYSDEMSSLILGLNSDLDYSYDKSEQLYFLGVKIIDEMCEYENTLKIFDFKIMEIDDIIDNVSDENLCLLREKLLNSTLSENVKFEKLKKLERSMFYGKKC